MKNLDFHGYSDEKSLHFRNSHYLTYTFLFQRMGECTFWTWEWKGIGVNYKKAKPLAAVHIESN